VARREDFARYRDRMTMPRKPAPFHAVKHEYLRRWRESTGIAEVSDEEVLRSRAAYWGLVGRVDELVGKILAALDQNGLAENTLIVYTSDHGDMQGEHGLWWKHVFYEESVRVPLILSWPGVIRSGERCARVVSALDVGATMLDALGGPPLPGSPGRSLLGLVSNARPTPTWDDVAFSEYCADEYTPDGTTFQRMIRRGPWKLVYYHGMAPQLFNLEDDPGELRDCADDPGCADVRAALTAEVLDGWNPDDIAATMAAKKAETGVLRQWARQTRPADSYRWELKGAMNRLDDGPGS
jgi:choline-sulfatase